MTTIATTINLSHHDVEEHDKRMLSHRLTRYAVPLGRALFALIFLMAVPSHFSAGTIEYARSHGVPFASLLVPASGVLALLGGISIALGLNARFGAFMLVVFLLPVTLMMHNFWSITDPQLATMQQIMFMKNVSLLGCALILTHVGAGPLSIDAQLFSDRRNRELMARSRSL